MSRARRLLEGALDRIGRGVGERSQDAADVAKLTPAEREHYERGRPAGRRSRRGVGGGARRSPPDRHRPPGAGRRGRPRRHQGAEAPRGHRGPAAWESRCRRARRPRRDARGVPRPGAPSGAHHARRDPREDAGAGDRRPPRLERARRPARSRLRRLPRSRPDQPRPARRRGRSSSGTSSTRPTAPCHPPSSRASLSLDARDVLVVRAAGEPAPLDEDLALDILARAGIGPERTLGDRARRHDLARPAARTTDAVAHRASVRGVHVFAAPRRAARRAAGAPWRIAEGPPEGVCLDVLQWDAIAQAVHPVRQHRPPLPSPFPYLPLTPQELLRAYLEIVGDRAGGRVLRAGHPRPPVRPDGTHEHQRASGAPAAAPSCRAPTASRASGWPAATTSSSPTGTRRSTRRAGRGSTPTRRPSSGAPAPQPRAARPGPEAPEPPDAHDRPRRRRRRVLLVGGTEDGFVAPRYCWPPRGA